MVRKQGESIERVLKHIRCNAHPASEQYGGRVKPSIQIAPKISGYFSKVYNGSHPESTLEKVKGYIVGGRKTIEAYAWT